MKKYILTFLLLVAAFSRILAQENKLNVAVFDGLAVAGYVDEGGFINFTGPNVNLTLGSSKFILGMLPSLRLKEDFSTPKNALITPSLGFGLTYCYRKLVFQVPVYYNAKTATRDGSWNLGFGLGVRFNKLKPKTQTP